MENTKSAGEATMRGTPYDFKLRAQPRDAYQSEVNLIKKHFLEGLQSELESMLKRPLQVTEAGISVAKYNDYQEPSSSYSLHGLWVEPVREYIRIHLDARLVFMIVDGFFGGGVTVPETKEPARFTPTEQRIVLRLLQRICKQLDQNWHNAGIGFACKPMDEMPPGTSRTEINITVIKFTVELGAYTGEIEVALSETLLTALRSSIETTSDESPAVDEAQWAHYLGEWVHHLRIEVKSVFAEVEISLGDLLTLKPGDLLPLNVADTVTVFAEHIPMFEAKAGDANGFVCARLMGPPV